jgi:hypothetical protein
VCLAHASNWTRLTSFRWCMWRSPTVKWCLQNRGDYFRFGSVFIKKNNQTKFFLKKNRNQFKLTGFSSIRFFRTKTCLTGFWLCFFLFDSVFFVWVWFGFFGFRLINRNRTEPVGFFKILIWLIGFFHGLVFSIIFFSIFSV